MTPKIGSYYLSRLHYYPALKVIHCPTSIKPRIILASMNLCPTKTNSLDFLLHTGYRMKLRKLNNTKIANSSMSPCCLGSAEGYRCSNRIKLSVLCTCISINIKLQSSRLLPLIFLSTLCICNIKLQSSRLLYLVFLSTLCICVSLSILKSDYKAHDFKPMLNLHSIHRELYHLRLKFTKGREREKEAYQPRKKEVQPPSSWW